MNKAKYKILIVEDEAIIAEYLYSEIEKYGYTPLEPALSFDEAVERLNEDSPDLVLLDINLKEDLNGLDLANLIRANFNIPYVFLTSSSDEQTLNEVKLSEASGLLLKPISSEQIYSCLEIVLHGKE